MIVMPDLASLTVFVAAALVLLLTPGPAVLYIVARSIDQGRRAGLVSMLGVHAGTLVHIGAAAAGGERRDRVRREPACCDAGSAGWAARIRAGGRAQRWAAVAPASANRHAPHRRQPADSSASSSSMRGSVEGL